MVYKTWEIMMLLYCKFNNNITLQRTGFYETAFKIAPLTSLASGLIVEMLQMLEQHKVIE